ncbi:hypothetical protein D021_2844B, partial [Vibrio parahaemolyticus 10296]
SKKQFITTHLPLTKLIVLMRRLSLSEIKHRVFWCMLTRT